MVEQLPDAGPDEPRVVLAQRVVENMVRGALLYPGSETGEALIGLIVPQAGRAEPDIYVLDTIGPGEDAVREWGMFEHGDDWQGDVLDWLHINWEGFRKLRRSSYGSALAAKWDVPLMHVGDWHKQPGDMIAPSSGDAQTARRMIADGETPVQHILAPIVTLYPLQAAATPALTRESLPASPADDAGSEAGQVPVNEPAPVPEAASVTADQPPLAPNTIVRVVEDEGWIVRIDCWYMSKRVRRFVPVAPVVWANEHMPGLPPLAWDLAHRRRFDQEFSLLKEAGYLVDVVRWDADGRPPFEICFSVYRPGAQQVVLLVTPYNYPAEMPAIRLAPLVGVQEGEDVFEKLYEASRPLLLTELPEWHWDNKRTLIELVWHVEQRLVKEGGT